MRVERFFTWKANDWEAKANIRGRLSDVSVSSMRTEGWIAYAKRQAAIYRSLITHYRFLWKDVPAHVARMEAIIHDPSLALPGEFDTTKAVICKV